MSFKPTVVSASASASASSKNGVQQASASATASVDGVTVSKTASAQSASPTYAPGHAAPQKGSETGGAETGGAGTGGAETSGDAAKAYEFYAKALEFAQRDETPADPAEPLSPPTGHAAAPTGYPSVDGKHLMLGDAVPEGPETTEKTETVQIDEVVNGKSVTGELTATTRVGPDQVEAEADAVLTVRPTTHAPAAEPAGEAPETRPIVTVHDGPSGLSIFDFFAGAVMSSLLSPQGGDALA